MLYAFHSFIHYFFQFSIFPSRKHFPFKIEIHITHSHTACRLYLPLIMHNAVYMHIIPSHLYFIGSFIWQCWNYFYWRRKVMFAVFSNDMWCIFVLPKLDMKLDWKNFFSFLFSYWVKSKRIGEKQRNRLN